MLPNEVTYLHTPEDCDDVGYGGHEGEPRTTYTGRRGKKGQKLYHTYWICWRCGTRQGRGEAMSHPRQLLGY